MGKYKIKMHVRLEIHTAHAGNGANESLLILAALCGKQESSNIVHLELFNWLNTD